MLTLLYLIMLVIGTLVSAYGIWRRRGSYGRDSESAAQLSDRFIRLAPVSAGVGAAVFGLAGLLLVWLTAVEPSMSVLWALGAGLVAGFATQVVLYYRAIQA